MRIQAYVIERKRSDSIFFAVEGAYADLASANARTGELNAAGYDCRLSYDATGTGLSDDRITEYHYAPRRTPT